MIVDANKVKILTLQEKMTELLIFYQRDSPNSNYTFVEDVMLINSLELRWKVKSDDTIDYSFLFI